MTKADAHWPEEARQDGKAEKVAACALTAANENAPADNGTAGASMKDVT
jgi:hypothetical protein